MDTLERGGGMACDNRCCFDSVCVVEQALIEHQTLIRSYSEICSEKPAWLHSIEASFDRFVVVFNAHQKGDSRTGF